MIIDPTRTMEQKRALDAKQIVADIYNSIKVDPRDYPQVERDFKEWIKDNSYIENYKNFKLVTPGKVLIRLYCFEKAIEREGANKILNIDGDNANRTLILPYAKVIQITDRYNNLEAKFKVGDILVCPDSISKVDVTDQWIAWRARMDKERPQINTPEPEKYDGILLHWSQSRLVIDKFNPTQDDKWTFVRDQNEFDIVYGVE